MNKAIALVTLARLGVNSIENLRHTVEICDKALENFQSGSPSYGRALMNKAVALMTLAELGINTVENLRLAEVLYSTALEIFERLGDKIDAIKVLDNLGILYYHTQNYERAYEVLKRAIEKIEDIRSEMLSPEEKRAFQETFIGAYRRMVLTCLKLGREEEAFTYAERAKSRTFIEMLAGGFETDDETARKINELLKRLEEIERTKKTGKGTREVEVLERESREIMKQLNRLYARLYRENPELYGLYRVQAVTPGELADVQESILMYYETNEGFVGFLVNDGKLTVKHLGNVESANEFFDELVKIYTVIGKGVNPICSSPYEQAKELLRKMYGELIKPFEGALKKDVIIVPHGILHYVPFSALFDGERYLIEKYNVKLAPSATSVKLLRSKDFKLKRALVVGNPNKGEEELELPNAEVEAQRVAEMLRSQGLSVEVLIGRAATREALKEKLKDADLFHYSGHAFFNPEEPKLSGLILVDGVFTMLDFLSIKLNAGLVVLSACETGMAKTSKGDEREGLVRAIQLAGAKYVIGTLWPVEDEAARLVFEEFYSSDGDFAKRLRRAQMKLLKGKKSEFYYWAPFQVYGA